MDAHGSGSAIRSSTHAAAVSVLHDFVPSRQVLVQKPVTALPGTPQRRTKIWEFNANLHCSIIGTCLSTAELRQFLKKLGAAPPSATDHELHGIAVGLAARQDEAARQLNKALDRAHKLAVAQFARAATDEDVRTLWRQALAQGDIQGAYWAVMTHPASTRATVRDVFGDVHMLSHLVGSANRADIRRLCQLEANVADLTARLDSQQEASHEAITARDHQIRDLRQALAHRMKTDAAAEAPADIAELRGRMADLERRLAAETSRRCGLEQRLEAATALIAQEQASRASAERTAEAVQHELHAAEASLAALCPVETAVEGQPSEAAVPSLSGITVLYVGGRTNHIPNLRRVAERLGATLLHHDGGLESHSTLLPGLVSRSDLVVFPVDCISHEAVLGVKALCRQGGKRFMPLRSASMASLLTALRQPDITVLPAAAE